VTRAAKGKHEKKSTTAGLVNELTALHSADQAVLDNERAFFQGTVAFVLEDNTARLPAGNNFLFERYVQRHCEVFEA